MDRTKCTTGPKRWDQISRTLWIGPNGPDQMFWKTFKDFPSSLLIALEDSPEVFIHKKFTNLRTNEDSFLNFSLTQPWNFSLRYSKASPSLFIPFTKFFIRPSLMCKGGRRILLRSIRGLCWTFFSPDCRISFGDQSFLL